MCMAKINVANLTFGYEGSYDTIFENVSFTLDSDWKLGLIGRNGTGKSTFLNLLLGKYTYQGVISSSDCFEYFPYKIEDKTKMTVDVIEIISPDYELWKVIMELEQLEVDAEVLYRPFDTLSFGEQTKVMLAVLFSRENYFLLVDEPTNHLDMPTREVIKRYLQSKKGFILVSHDRDLLDACVDHILAINRNTIEVQKGNFSSWWENKQRQDAYELSENNRLKKEIGKLEAAAERTARWAEKVESKKIGFDPKKEHDRFIDSRAYIGEKSRRMQKRRKGLEQRQQNAIEEKEGLLKNIEKKVDLKIMPMKHHKESYVRFQDVEIGYGETCVIKGLSFELKRGERLVIQGMNGCGKSSVIKAILQHENTILLNGQKEEIVPKNLYVQGNIEIAKGLKVSYINQDTTKLKGRLEAFIEHTGAEESLFKAILRQLDFERVQFDKNMEEYSEGQKKKVLIASSLLTQAHLYIWDEPLNYIDVFSRMQIEELLKSYELTMLLIEHDKKFCEKVGSRKLLI